MLAAPQRVPARASGKGRLGRQASVLPADLDGGRRVCGGAGHLGCDSEGRRRRRDLRTGVQQAGRRMNEPGRRHRGGGKRRDHDARQAGSARRRRIRGGRPSGAPPSRRPRPAPLPRGLHGRRRSQRQRALGGGGGGCGTPLPEGSVAVGWRACARTARAGAEQAERPAADTTQAGGQVVECPRGACVRGCSGRGRRESTGRFCAPARRFATGRGRPPMRSPGEARPGRARCPRAARRPLRPALVSPGPTARGAKCADAQGSRPFTPIAADSEPRRPLTPVGLSQQRNTPGAPSTSWVHLLPRSC